MDSASYPAHCQMMRRALKERDNPQDVVAAIMGHSRSTVNAILTGRQHLTARLAIDYGLACGLSPEELLRQQSSWILSITPFSETKRAAIRLRVQEVTARIAGDIDAEISSLERQRAAIDERITKLNKFK